MSTTITEFALQVAGGLFLALIILLLLGSLIRKIERSSKNPACYIIGHSIKVGSKINTRVYAERWDSRRHCTTRRELLWSCTRKGCPKEFRSQR